LSEELQAKQAGLLSTLNAAGFQPPTSADLCAQAGLTESDFKVLVEHAVDREEMSAVGEFVLSQACLNKAEAAIVANCTKNTELSIPELRDALDTSRKYLIPILEHFDAKGVTARSAGTRILKSR
jgi:selenocysteine-specific elongation factor